MTLFVAMLSGCVLTHHPVTPWSGPEPSHHDLDAVLGQPVQLEADVIVSATWEVDQAGLVDLRHPATAELPRGDVPIQLPVVRVRHPTQGTVFIDTGVDEAFTSGGPGPGRGLVRGFLDGITPRVSLGSLVEAETTVAAVLLTHLHMDHVLGLPDVPVDVPVFVGRDEGRTRDVRHAVVGSTYRALLGDRGPLMEFAPEHGVELGGLPGAQDLFGDGAIWALPAPGHTLGTTVYFLNTTPPVLVLGDASHTCWGWEHDVPPGTFSHDRKGAEVSFRALRTWATQIPDLTVVAGHTACDD